MPRKTRKYAQTRRAQSQDETRQRIVEATVELHTTLGPARTSIVAIAERAGVERPTVYRHFPTTEALFTACTNHHWEHNPRAEPEGWRAINDPRARMRQGLSDIYAYYAVHESELWVILRDLEDNPDLRRFGAHNVHYREHVLEVLESAWSEPKDAKALRAILSHAIDFFAWRSLRRQGFTNDEAAELMIGLTPSP